MAWIKRNLFFVISLVVGVGLVGWAGWFLFSAYKDDQQAGDDLTQTRTEYDTMRSKNPFPSDDHIKEAQAQAKELKDFVGALRKSQLPPPPAQKMDDVAFVKYLNTNRAEWAKQAAEAGVTLPEGYWFTFSSISNVLSFSKDSTAQWLPQIEDLKLLLRVIYASHVDALDLIQRVPVALEDAGSMEFMSVSAKTNEWGVAMPYQLTLHATPAQLGLLVDGFARSPNCLVLRFPDVTEETADTSLTPTMAAGPASPNYNPYAAHMAAQRSRAPIMPTPGAGTPSSTPHPSAPVTILTPQKLRVVMLVDVVRLKP